MTAWYDPYGGIKTPQEIFSHRPLGAVWTQLLHLQEYGDRGVNGVSNFTHGFSLCLLELDEQQARSRTGKTSSLLDGIQSRVHALPCIPQSGSCCLVTNRKPGICYMTISLHGQHVREIY